MLMEGISISFRFNYIREYFCGFKLVVRNRKEGQPPKVLNAVFQKIANSW